MSHRCSSYWDSTVYDDGDPVKALGKMTPKAVEKDESTETHARTHAHARTHTHTVINTVTKWLYEIVGENESSETNTGTDARTRTHARMHCPCKKTSRTARTITWNYINILPYSLLVLQYGFTMVIIRVYSWISSLLYIFVRIASIVKISFSKKQY